jgi:hypothetical protein
MFQKIELRRMRDFSAKINATFEFVKQNLKPLARGLIFISGPFLLLQGLFSGLYQKQVLTSGLSANPLAMFSGDTFMWLGISMTFSLFGYMCSLLVITEFMKRYETHKDPETIDLPELWEGVKSNFLKMVGVAVILAALLTASMVFFIIPFFYFSVVLSLIVPIMIIEEKGFGEAFSRCFTLISQKWWSTFGLIVITSIIVGVMTLVFTIPQYFFTFLIGAHKISGGSGSVEPPLWEQIGLILSSMIIAFGGSLMRGIVVIAVIFQYYNLVERRESRGLLSKVESFGQPEEAKPAHDETY